MISRDAGLALAHIVSFLVAVSVNYSLNSKWSFRQHHDGSLQWHQFGRFLTVGAFALLLRGGVLTLLVHVWQVPPSWAIFPAIFATALARNLFDKSTAMVAVLLLAVLPMGFATGLVITTDAPLIVAWAATLYYMERALVAGSRSAWLGMGIAFGLGLLSKYTLGLLGIAALIFVMLDPIARQWMKRPHPYLAAMLALLIFSPVIIWNYENDWASFVFQSTRVLEDEHRFSVHYLILLYLSTFDLPRFHWNGPIWLAILPSIAWMIKQPGNLQGITSRLYVAWRPTIVACIFANAFILHYVVLGIPGIPYKIISGVTQLPKLNKLLERSNINSDRNQLLSA